MKTLIKTTICLLTLMTTCFAQDIPSDSLYFGLPVPGDSAVKMTSSKVCVPDGMEASIVFTKNQKTAFIWNTNGDPSIAAIYKVEYTNKWSNPVKAEFTNGRSCGEPFCGDDSNRVYMNTNNAVGGTKPFSIAYSIRNEAGVWGDPIAMPAAVNSASYNWHPTVVGSGNVYTVTNAGPLAMHKYENGTYGPRVVLPAPINKAGVPQCWGDPWIAQDESYMIIGSKETGGLGATDLYISYRKSNGKWTNPKNLGNKINTPGEDSEGDITPDGKYMTFSRAVNGSFDLYWVSTSFVQRLKTTNYKPYVFKTIPTRTDTLNKTINYTIPDTTFIDDDGNNTLTYSASLNNGSPLPSWLNFNNGTFSGTAAATGTFTIKITATDTLNCSVSTNFNLKIVQGTGIEEIEKTEYLVKAYPNPFNPATTISFNLQKPANVELTVYNSKGEAVANLVNRMLPAGMQSAVFNAADLNSGIYFYRLAVDGESVIGKIALIK